MRKICPSPPAFCAIGLAAGLFTLISINPLLAAVPDAEADAPPTTYKILIEDDGVYRVDYSALAHAGLKTEVPSQGLGLSVAGEVVPIWIEDGGDGIFGAGDHFEFIGRRLVGERSWVHDYAWLNVFRLDIAGGGLRMSTGRQPIEGASEAYPRVRRHLEEDKMLVRLPGSRATDDDPWFWAKMVHNRPEPTLVPLDLSGFDPQGTVDLTIEVRGWSRPHNKASGEIFDHALAIKLANLETGRERVLSVESWNGKETYRIELKDLPGSHFGATSELRLMVPMRKEAKEGRALIDVQMLNSVSFTYDHGGVISSSGPGVRLEWTAGGFVTLATASEEGEAPGAAAIAYGEGGSRIATVPLRVDGEESAWVVSPEGWLQPAAVVADAPSTLRSKDQQADYLMITPHSFTDAVAPLAALHRKRGLNVEVVEVQDIYDEFNHGIAHPRAIRDFIAHAHGEWQAPAPRFVLLVGDASWDVKNAEAIDAHYADWTYRRGESRDFAKNESTPYEGETGRSRHYIPTWQTTTGQGHAASDNFFVDPDGDGIPDLAIGRLPVASVGELEPIVRKITRYIEEPESGDWRRGMLFVTNEQKRYQNYSDRLVDQVAEEGFLPQKIYPESTETSNAANTEALVEAIGGGQLLVHFIGHGGRYIWRTGPPDLEKNHDLFTLEDLDRLPSTGRLPVIVSMTCYSAPFDHPTADSIGEKFIRLEDRGAIGVIAASWRNSPSYLWGQVILRELTREGATIGEALMVAKQEIQGRMFRETYLLLGDPAVPVALPPGHDRAVESVASLAPGLGSEGAGNSEPGQAVGAGHEE